MKKKIVIASTLKPIDDVRGYWKLGQTLAKTNKYEVNIIGNKSKKPPKNENVVFHEFSIRRNQWLKRLLLPFRILRNFYQIKPDLILISAHELLLIAVFYSAWHRCKLIYDVQENYLLNAQFLNHSFVHYWYGHFIRLKEKQSDRFIDHYLLAETCYLNEIPHIIKSKALILENKALDIDIGAVKKKKNQLLFSGTISYYSGVSLAVNFFENLKEKASYQLLIIGQIHDANLEKWLQLKAHSNQNINLNISFDPVPYTEILKAIKSSEIGLIPYQPNQVNQNKIPTKAFEYARFGLLSIMEKDTHWERHFRSSKRTQSVHFSSQNSTIQPLTAPDPPLGSFLWEDVKSDFTSLIDHLLK